MRRPEQAWPEPAQPHHQGPVSDKLTFEVSDGVSAMQLYRASATEERPSSPILQNLIFGTHTAPILLVRPQHSGKLTQIQADCPPAPGSRSATR